MKWSSAKLPLSRWHVHGSLLPKVEIIVYVSLNQFKQISLQPSSVCYSVSCEIKQEGTTLCSIFQTFLTISTFSSLFLRKLLVWENDTSQWNERNRRQWIKKLNYYLGEVLFSYLLYPLSYLSNFTIIDLFYWDTHRLNCKSCGLIHSQKNV